MYLNLTCSFEKDIHVIDCYCSVSPLTPQVCHLGTELMAGLSFRGLQLCFLVQLGIRKKMEWCGKYNQKSDSYIYFVHYSITDRMNSSYFMFHQLTTVI